MMKRLFYLCIVLCMLLSMVGCGGNGSNNADTTETTEQKQQSLVADPLTWDEINAIPIASADMTEDELRQIIVKFMQLQTGILWEPNEKMPYENNDKFYLCAPGKVYGGCRYITTKDTSLYNYMNYYDEKTGILDAKAMMAEPFDYREILGNQCSSSTYWAWSRVSNSITYGVTAEMVEARGCIPVGPYVVPVNIFRYDRQNDNVVTHEVICKYNGEQVMYQSYANMKPADGMVYYDAPNDAGHVIMCHHVEVVYNADGTIDGNRSKLYFLDQDCTNKVYDQSNGVQANYYGHRGEGEFTFKRLYDVGYIPWRIPEFCGKSEVEKATVQAGSSAESITVNDLRRMDITANYPISYTQVVVKDAAGNELYKDHNYSMALNCYKIKAANSGSMDTNALTKLADGKNTVEVSVRVGTGELLHAYTAILKAN